MAGLEDYQFYSYMKEGDSPFRKLATPLPANQPVQPNLQVQEDKHSEKSRNHLTALVALATEHLVSHPFLVLRRQCQVNEKLNRYHVIPITLIPVVYRLHRSQGLSMLWKGIGSALVVKGLVMGLEDCFSKFTPWPLEVNALSRPNQIAKHLLLKSVCLALATPFYSASLVETVQSDIASETPGLFDVFTEGMCRVLTWIAPQHRGRMLSVFVLIPPTVVYGIGHYVTKQIFSKVAAYLIDVTDRTQQQKQGARIKDDTYRPSSNTPRMLLMCAGHMMADIILFPLETVVNRLHLQGTRTIIDSLDTGLAVVPVMTSYEGALDCWRTVVAQEGVLALYKGFGALVLQYIFCGATLVATAWAAKQFSVINCENNMRLKISTNRLQLETLQTPSEDPQQIQNIRQGNVQASREMLGCEYRKNFQRP